MLNSHDLSIIKKISPFRSARLFKEFLPKGYKITTLDSVKNKGKIVELKIILGTIITLYDDLADRPDRFNPRLLKVLYQIPFEDIKLQREFLNLQDKEILDLIESLFERLLHGLEMLRNYEILIKLFSFDLKQFFLANHYSEMLTEHPEAKNHLENKLYLHHNMGIVMAGMIDLMSLSHFDKIELGNARSLFLLGQRAGRISNVLTTYEREQRENDTTSEMMSKYGTAQAGLMLNNLETELKSLLQKMGEYGEYNDIKSFSPSAYRKGIKSLHDLHLKFKGVI